MTHEQYVTLETARLLKQVGFDWEVNSFYQEGVTLSGRELDKEELHYGLITATDWNHHKSLSDNRIYYSAPTQAVAQRYIREVKGVDVRVYYVDGGNWAKDDEMPNWWQGDINRFGSAYFGGHAGRFRTFEEAMEAYLKECLTQLIEYEHEKANLQHSKQ